MKNSVHPGGVLTAGQEITVAPEAPKTNVIDLWQPCINWSSEINWQVDEFYITGYQDNFALLVSLPDKAGGFKEVGTVSTGFTAAHKMTFYMVSSQLTVK